MMPEIKKILYATDLSKNSAYAFRYAVNSAKHHDAKLFILHVYDTLSVSAQNLVSSYLTEDQAKKLFESKKESAYERIKKRLKILCDQEFEKEAELMGLIDSIKTKKGFPNEDELMDMIDSIVVKEGYPAELILQTAEEKDIDAIIMGTHGQGFIENTFLGSTAKRVLRRTRKPIMVIPIPRGNIDVTIKDP